MTTGDVKGGTAALRFGVAGAGSLGFHHARIARDLPGVTLSGFFDAREARSAEVSESLGVRAFSALDALLDEVDALIVATPTVAHREVAVAALERGIHVFIEKPIAPSLEDADAIGSPRRRISGGRGAGPDLFGRYCQRPDLVRGGRSGEPHVEPRLDGAASKGANLSAFGVSESEPCHRRGRVSAPAPRAPGLCRWGRSSHSGRADSGNGRRAGGA
jgi:hypothetical protein